MAHDSAQGTTQLEVSSSSVIQAEFGTYTYTVDWEEVRDNPRPWDDDDDGIVCYSYDVPIYRTVTLWRIPVYEIIDRDRGIVRHLGECGGILHCTEAEAAKRWVREYEAKRRAQVDR